MEDGAIVAEVIVWIYNAPIKSQLYNSVIF